MATTNGIILIGGLAVAYMWWKKNNGAGFSPVMASTEMTGNPSGFSLSNIQNANWAAQWNNATPPSTYALGQMRQSGNYSL